MIQANFGQAMAHIQSGSKILCEIKYNEQTKQNQHSVLTASPLPYVPMETLLEIYLRLDFQLRHVRSSTWKSFPPQPYSNISSDARWW